MAVEHVGMSTQPHRPQWVANTALWGARKAGLLSDVAGVLVVQVHSWIQVVDHQSVVNIN